MSRDKVVDFPATSTMTVEQALSSALKADGLKDVVIIGEFSDGQLFVRSSRMSRAEALFMLEMGKRWSMGDLD